ncbi:MAG: hypothetical protein ACAI35_19300 [Candidatus Methylacidiphilales bacterium]|nr:hypothetical protein [Candidatus Methylacidiphilales bacterium]
MNENLSIEGHHPADKYFFFELADRIAEKIGIDDTPASADRLSALPEH